MSRHGRRCLTLIVAVLLLLTTTAPAASTLAAAAAPACSQLSASAVASVLGTPMTDGIDMTPNTHVPQCYWGAKTGDLGVLLTLLTASQADGVEKGCSLGAHSHSVAGVGDAACYTDPTARPNNTSGQQIAVVANAAGFDIELSTHFSPPPDHSDWLIALAKLVVTGQAGQASSAPTTVASVAPAPTPTPITIPGPPGCARTPLSTDPKLVAIFVFGMGSTYPYFANAPYPKDRDPVADTAAYDPLAYSYCHIADQMKSNPSMPPGITSIPSYFDGQPADSGPSLTYALASKGAVLLPYSYNGAALSRDIQGRVQFHAAPFNQDDATNEPLDAESAHLNKEITSVHKVWPGAAIIVLGHSWGGAVVGRYFEKHWSANSGVVNMTTTDAPINGIAATAACLLPTHSCESFHLHNTGAQALLGLWSVRDQRDPELLAKDSGHVFTPIGTDGDADYVGDLPCNGLVSQVLTPGAIPGLQAVGCRFPTLPTPPDFVNPRSTTPSALFTGHMHVLASPEVIAAIAGRAPASAVTAARLVLRQAQAPSATATTTTVMPNTTMTLTGTDLGATPGSVIFQDAGGGGAAGQIRSWGPTAVTVVVPGNAQSGYLTVIRQADQATAAVGPISVLGPDNGVASLHTALGSGNALAGTDMTITVTALSAAAKPVPGVDVALTVGTEEIHATTDGNGNAALVVRGYAAQTWTVHSGTASAVVAPVWTEPPPMSLQMDAVADSVGVGSGVKVTAHLVDAAGHPASGQVVRFVANGPAGASVSQGEVVTDSSGAASITVSSARPGPLAVSAIANDDTTTASAVLDVTASTAAPPLAYIAAGAAVLLIVIAVVIGRRRRRRPGGGAQHSDHDSLLHEPPGSHWHLEQ